MAITYFLIFAILLHIDYGTSFSLQSNFSSVDNSSIVRDKRHDYRQHSTKPIHRHGCSSRQVTCYSGFPTCISQNQLCDGTIDCNDGSDETHLKCAATQCEDYLFRCSYGACVDGDKLCDGVQDCADNSDETHPDCAVVDGPDTCRPKEFTCDNGECIPAVSVCDGTAECADQSDETARLCGASQCSDFLFRCSYGACVDGDAVCNGEINCVDGSDEIEQFCQFKRHEDEQSIVTEGCELPIRPRNGGYRIPNLKLSEGQLVPIGTYLTFFCNPGYVLRPARAIIVQCLKTMNWTATTPICLVECPAISSISQDITYSVPEGQPLIPGTTATIKCKDAYQPPPNDPLYRHITCLSTGQWNLQVFNCTPKCGIATIKLRPLVVNGKDADAPDFPWNVGVYRSNPQYREDHQHICGGTIVTELLMLSAAHCFYDTSLEGLNPKSEYSIGAGKVYRDWYANKTIEPYQQLRKVHQIIMHREYKGVFSSHINDIAYLVLKSKEHLQFNDVVRPACIDWDSDYKNLAFKKNNLGTVVGWGLTTPSGNRSEVLKKISLPFIPKHPDCFKSLPENVRHYLLHDKICAGTLTGSGVCQGDSGSGLMFPYAGNGLWYLRAIVSFDPAFGDSCDPNTYTAFTDISFHMKWIQTIYSKIL